MKKKFFAKALSTIVAAACSVNALAVTNIVGSDVGASAADVYEFEDGTLSNPSNIKEGTDHEGNPIDVNASGGKYVFLNNAGETASVEVTVEETGMYDLTISAYAPYGNKLQNLIINGVSQGVVSFEENKTDFVDVSAGMYKLNKGTNTVTIESSWGWVFIDCLKVSPAEFPSIETPKALVDSKATDETKRLMSYLNDVYGNNILSGQQEIYMYGPHGFEYEFDWLKEKTGKYPAVRGFDFLNSANILYGTEDGTTDRMIDWAKNKNGIVTASWHVTVPKNFASYEHGVTKVDYSNATYAVWADDDNNTHTKPATDFDTSKVLEEGSKENIYYMACLEALAGQIKKLQDANVPIILRPLHEAEGGGGEEGSWFWWGQDGSAVYKDLWKLTYKTLTETYDLHNIIWEWNSYTYASSKDWYPGDEYVDIIGYDKYNCTDWSTGNAILKHNDSAISGTFYNLVDMYKSKKLVAMAENDSFSTVDNLTTEKAGWLYFCTWYDGGSDNINFLSNEVFNKLSDTIAMYQSDYCITLDEIPENLYSTYSLDGFGEVPPETTETTEATEETTETTEASTEESTAESTEVSTESTESTEGTETTDTSIEFGTPSKMGDVNLDTAVGLTDLVLLAKHVSSPTAYPLKNAIAAANADVTHDKLLDSLDVDKLSEYNLLTITDEDLEK